VTAGGRILNVTARGHTDASAGSGVRRVRGDKLRRQGLQQRSLERRGWQSNDDRKGEGTVGHHNGERFPMLR
jgi:hypothetical protein